MDSKGVWKLGGRISSAVSFLSLIIANGEGTDKHDDEQLPHIVRDEDEEMVVVDEEGEERRPQVNEGVQNPVQEIHTAEQVDTRPRPTFQEVRQLLEEIKRLSPGIGDAVQSLRRELRALGYEFTETGQDPAQSKNKTAGSMLSMQQVKDSPTTPELQKRPLRAVHEDGQLREHEDEEGKDEKPYPKDTLKIVESQQMTTDPGVEETGDDMNVAEDDDMNEAAAVPVRDDDELSYSSADEDEFQAERGGGEEEEDVDMNTLMPCPVLKVTTATCDWLGTLRNLKRHLNNRHDALLRSGNIIYCKIFQKAMSLIRYHGELFLYYKHISYTGIMYAAVQQVGLTNKKFKYTISLIADDPQENINFTFAVTHISVPFEILFDSFRCAAITEDRLDPFVKNDQIEMAVHLREVILRKKNVDRPSSTQL